MSTSNRLAAIQAVSYILIAIALVMILRQGLLAALLSGLLVYSLVHLLAPLLAKRFSSAGAKLLAVAALSALTIGLLSAGIWLAVSFFRSDAGSVQALLQKMADIIEASRSQMPPWVIEHLPDDAESLREMMTSWLRAHSVEAKIFGQEAGRSIAHVLIGMIIGAMVALHDTTESQHFLPLAAALRDRLTKLSYAFEQIVFAQVRIAAINAALTAVYIFIILPIAGIHLPMAKSLVLITFFAGMLPVLGNLISNTVLVIAALSHSLYTAVASLLFMIVIHKLEYFLNARIIGAHINARAWELLVAMLVMESLFGIPGVVAAPVFYAYLKQELMEHKLV